MILPGDILSYWGQVEADFLRYYGIDKPQDVEYRKFLRLLRNLPADGSVFYGRLREDQITIDEETGKVFRKEEYNKESKQARRMLQRQHKRHNRPRERVSIDQFLGGKSGITGKG